MRYKRKLDEWCQYFNAFEFDERDEVKEYDACAICLIDVNPRLKKKYISPQCGHMFHYSCIEQYVEQCGAYVSIPDALEILFGNVIYNCPICW